MQIRRAILSVSNKDGIVDLARFLTGRGVEILSTGGTAKHLTDAAIPVTPIASWSGAPEILGGRVKTLTPKVFGSILFDRSKESHIADCKANAIPPVDLVVVNLYPFEETIARGDVSIAEAVEQIDVGGPSMLRAAAKNHAHVVPLCSPLLYPEFMREMESGDISPEFRLRAAIEVYRLTAGYDAAIAAFLTRDSVTEGLPESISLRLVRAQELRYGENPQQLAGFYRTAAASTGEFKQLQGKELSFNNLIDLDAAIKLASSFDRPSCAIIKHTNPCGVAVAEAAVADAFRSAIAADPVSAFGGIVGTNREVTEEAARVIEPLFLEVVVAPSFSPAALELLGKKKNLRLIQTRPADPQFEIRSAAGGYLLQSPDRISSPEGWSCSTRRAPTEAEMRGLEFAWIVCAHVKSNAIVLTNSHQSIGIGAGQMSRVDSARLAIMKATLPTAGAVAASDAFFPFADGLSLLLDAGITAVVQPGGSVRDHEVIAAADDRGIAMMFTGERHFRH
ncbi:MAG TPA: bifunctional phosphoribosylaminoimidazolecarboxamide formyltransferase/IMP cyclohydrolase [Thermoanaerobaculia bacterium]|nr:bifunctional phosphoribosylaminoimidazolecarboxamide formyltransferase/IMP cyclohydrolase [Thermoanaerobaculia bacterium]